MAHSKFSLLISSVKIFIKSNLPAIVLVLLTLLLCRRNYSPDTFLTGWDTLHPEFNYKIYLPRVIFGAWQTHQGLGAVATQAHAGELPRILILLVLNLVFKMSQIRYAYAFLMLVIGPLGVFSFLNRIVLKRFTSGVRNVGAFAGGLFYLLNLGTMQHFYVPLEMFLTHYGFLGWVMLFTCQFLETRSKKSLISFILVTFFTSSQAHTSTLFYAFIINYSGFLFFYVLLDMVTKSPNAFKSLKGGVLLLALTMFINLFWFLPNIYFAANHGKEIQESKIHHLFSEEAFLQNKEFGDPKDIFIVRNFLFNWGEHVGNGQFGDLLDEWKAHLDKPIVLPLGYAFFAMIALGIVISTVLREKYSVPSFAIFALSIFFLLNVNPPFGGLFIFFQDHLPLFKEAFRFPFTKFSITLILSYAIFFGYFWAFVSALVEKVFKKFAPFRWYFTFILYAFILFSLIYYMLPAFKGYLISPSMRVNIPDRYFEMFKYLNDQPEYGRVADFPIHTFWGWVYHNWDPETELGYQGAGFLWFGIKQPLLDREFDRWNLDNEYYYYEMSYAVYSENPVLFKQTLDKFKIKWLLVDKSVLNVGGSATTLFLPQLEKLIKSVEGVNLAKDFGNGLAIYEYKPAETFNLIEKNSSFVNSADSIFKEYTDPIYANNDVYINEGTKNYPYAGITGFEENVLSEFVTSDSNQITFNLNTTSENLLAKPISDSTQYVVSTKYTSESSLLLSLQSTLTPNAAPISFTLPVSRFTNGALSINNTVFSVHPTNDSETLGLVYLKSSDPLKVAFYNSDSPYYIKDSGNEILEPCSDFSDMSTYSIEKSSEGFKLLGRNIKSCVTLGLNAVDALQNVEGDLLILSAKSVEMGAKSSLCILDSVTGLCINSKTNDGVTYAFINGADKGRYFTRFFADARSIPIEVGVLYSNVALNLVKPAFSSVYSLDQLAETPTSVAQTVSVTKDPRYSGFVPNMEGNTRYCNTGERYINYFSDQNVLRYSAIDQSVCDSYEFPTLSHDMGYLIEIKSANIEGLPLRFCLTNEYSKRCDIYTSLPANKTLTSNFYLVPPMGNGVGYTLNFSSLLFGSDPAINDLSYISITPFPYSLLRSLHVPVTPVQGKELVIYNESFEKGWVALCGLLPCQAAHVKVNNWSNGWVFEGSAPDLSNIKIVFWPQILEFLSFGVLAAVGIFAFRYREK